MEDGARELRAANERLLFQNSSQGDLLNEILAKVRDFPEIKTPSNFQSSQMCDCSAQTAAKIDELKEMVTKANKMFTEGLGALLQNVAGPGKTHSFLVTGVSCLRERAVRELKAPCMSEKLYMFGYLISSGFYAIIIQGSVSLCCRIVVHKGIADDYLQWPFKHAFKLSIIHPYSFDRQQEHRVEDYSIGRQESETGSYLYFVDHSFELNDLTREGYVTNDNLKVRFELLPSS